MYLTSWFSQVKDTMRLLGVVNSFPMLISRVGIGGPAAVWVIKEFTSQMHAVSKVALHRRSNLALFLETHGMFIVHLLYAIRDSYNFHLKETLSSSTLIFICC